MSPRLRGMAGFGHLTAALALLALLCAGAQACTGDCDRHEDDDVTLMQMTSRVQGTDKRTSLIEATGRTLYSTQPTESAKFLATYLNNATLVALPVCDHAERAAVDIQTGSRTKRFVFVKDTTVPQGALPMDELIAKSNKQMATVFDGSAVYSPWIDNHDGWGIWHLDCEKVVQDKLEVLVHRHATTTNVRLNIPHTIWHFEFYGTDAEAKDVDALNSMVQLAGVAENMNLCRDNDKAKPPAANLPWIKATYMATNMSAAVEWSVAVLGASLVPSAYPWPPVPECEAALWVVLPDEFALRFAYNARYEQGMDPTIATIAADAEKTFLQEAVGLGHFEEYMYNSIIFEVASLDPYLKRLMDHDYPFMFARSATGYIVFAIIPGNDITLQLRSSHASVGEPVQFDMCTQVV